MGSTWKKSIHTEHTFFINCIKIWKSYSVATKNFLQACLISWEHFMTLKLTSLYIWATVLALHSSALIMLSVEKHKPAALFYTEVSIGYVNSTIDHQSPQIIILWFLSETFLDKYALFCWLHLLISQASTWSYI